MNQIVHLRQVVQVKRQRANLYATVDLINADGSIKKRDKNLVVQFPDYAKEAATAGTLWEVTGKEVLNQFIVNGFSITEYTIDADNVKFLKPSGRILSRWISSNVKGVGSVIASRLVRVKNLADLINKQNKNALLDIAGMSEECVKSLIEKWPDENLYKTINWLEEQKLPLGLGEKLVTIFGAGALEQVKVHPFLLMAMGASFEQTAQLAFKLGLTMEDHSVIAGVAQHVAIKHAAKYGSTVISLAQLKIGCLHAMKQTAPKNVGGIACEQGLLVEVIDGYQVFGT
jgi:exodeoxyribonuclease V alpha subunit